MHIVPKHVHFGLIYLKIKGTVTKFANYNELYGSKKSWIMRQSFKKGSVQTIVTKFFLKRVTIYGQMNYKSNI